MKNLTKKKRQLNRPFFNKILLFLFVLLLPTQFGKHFFFDFSYLSGIRVDYLAPAVYTTDILAIVIFIFNFKSIVNFLRNKKIILLFAFLLINVLFALSKPIALYRLIKIVEFVVVLAVARKKIISPLIMFMAFLTGSMFEIVLVLVQFISKHSLQGMFYFFGERFLTLSTPNVAKAALSGIEFLRPYGTFSHPNSLAGFYLLLYVFILENKKINSSFLKILFLFLSTVLIFLSFSKIAILGLVLINIIHMLINKVQKNCLLCFTSRMITFGILTFIFLQARTDPTTVAKRIELAKNSVSLIMSHPIIGVGIGNYLIAQNSFTTKFTDFINQPVHNIFLLYFAEIGVMTGIILIIIFKNEIIKFTKNWLLILLVITITGFFDHYWLTLQQNFLLLPFILGSL